MKKLCTSLREHAKNIIDFEKKNVTINEGRTKIISRGKSMSHLWKKNLKKMLKIIMIIILLLKMSLKDNLNVVGKTKKSTKRFMFQ